MPISSKFFQKFRNLKTDAAPSPPRESANNNNARTEPPSDQHETYTVEDKDCSDEEIPFDNETKKKPDKKKREIITPSSSPVNTQAAGNVINIVNSSNVHWGPEFTYYMGTSSGECTAAGTEQQRRQDEAQVKKTPDISNLLKADVKPEFVYMDYVAKNLGRSWQSLFRRLGYSQGRVDTVLEETQPQLGVSEARYKLLLDWVRNDEEGTLGALASALWKHGERRLVEGLAAVYKQRST